MEQLNYWLFRLSVLLFQCIPFPLLYLLSDVLSWQLYHLFRYRRKVVEEQLRNSFPDHSTAQLKAMARQSYSNLSDIILESIKGFTVSKEELMRRINYSNANVLEKYRLQGQSILLVAPHQCNWEWGVITLPLVLPHKSIGFYKPLSNRYIEAYTAQKRSRLGMHLAPTKTTSLTFEQHQHTPCSYIMMADQNPPSMGKSYWVDFLRQPTACVIGPEKHARRQTMPIVLAKVTRPQRGYYDIMFEIIMEPPFPIEEGSITEKIMHHFEQIIRENPHNWLWTHRRWKKKPPPKEQQ